MQALPPLDDETGTLGTCFLNAIRRRRVAKGEVRNNEVLAAALAVISVTLNDMTDAGRVNTVAWITRTLHEEMYKAAELAGK